MKKTILMLILLSLVLTGCGTQPTVADTRIQVSIIESGGCAVENNGQWVEPGGDAVFLMELEDGTTLAGTDFDGSFSTEIKDGKLELTLKNVRYPVRVALELTQSFCTVTYDPNGGEGERTVKTYDLTHHLRPNTDTGIEMFSRDGFTLTGWNTQPDGSGTLVGLGSRVTVDGSLTLYAQWEPWTAASEFDYSLTQYRNITINGYHGDGGTVVIPAYIDGYPVTAVAARAFRDSTVSHVILPETMDRIAPDAFMDCKTLESVMLWDSIQVIADSAFIGCDALRTAYINAIEAPYGYAYRKESVYADKVDLMILAQGQKKMVFYAGCSVWYNLDGPDVYAAFDGEYTVINMGLNGTVNSQVQMQILDRYLEPGDVLVHTLELTSELQLLHITDMLDGDDKLWAGLEYNYDLVSLVDLRTVEGLFDTLCDYLTNKKEDTTYSDTYTDRLGHTYMDEYGCVPFQRDSTRQTLTDKVHLDLNYVQPEGMNRLERWYDRWRDMGVAVYISYACVNLDAVPAEEQGNVETMDELVRYAVGQMDSAVLVSTLSDFIFRHNDFYDTNYHLRSAQARANTAIWVRDLKAQMALDGLWKEGAQ